MSAQFRYLGEAAALGTALCWSLSAVNFEAASKRVGSHAVNIIRLLIAFLLLAAFNFVTQGSFLPLDASPRQWIWLSVSGLIGFTLGDLFLFEAFVQIGARISMLIMAGAPAITAILGYAILGESLSLRSLIGMSLCILGICLVVLKPAEGRLRLRHPLRGILMALLGAIGQALGLILSKIGMDTGSGQNYSATMSTQIRVLAGFRGFIVLYSLMGYWPRVFKAFRDPRGLGYTAIGAICGPFIGVSLSLVAVSNTKAGIASCLMSITPVLIIPISLIVFREKARKIEIAGAIVAICGVALMFI